MLANSVDRHPEWSTASGLCLHCLPMSQTMDAMLIWVNGTVLHSKTKLFVGNK